MTPAEHKEYVLAAWRDATPALMVKYLETLAGAGADVDDLRKAVELMTKTTGAEVEKKQDPHANLPVFQVVFQGATIQATVAQEPSATRLEASQLDLLEQVVDVQPKPARAPLPEPDFSDADAMLASLDDQLKALDN